LLDGISNADIFLETSAYAINRSRKMQMKKTFFFVAYSEKSNRIPKFVLKVFFGQKLWNLPYSMLEFYPNQSVFSPITAFFRPLFQHSSSTDCISSQTSKLRICAMAVLKCYELVYKWVFANCIFGAFLSFVFYFAEVEFIWIGIRAIRDRKVDNLIIIRHLQ